MAEPSRAAGRPIAPPPSRAPLASPPTEAAAYLPGVCNIGPAEVARRMRAGHAGLVASVALFAGLAAIDAPAPARFAVALPAAIAASGYLQARFRFCVKFASLGVFNFGDVGPTTGIADGAARAADRRRALEIGLACAAIGTLVGIGAVLVGR